MGILPKTSKPRAKDLSGQKFGRWTVIERDLSVGVGHNIQARWICQCECGATKSVYAASLRNGDSKSCGCALAEFNREMALKRVTDLSGQRFGRWLVLSRDLETVRYGGRRTNYICQCDCGTLRSVPRQALTQGESKSCGCLHKEIVGNILRIHGYSNLKIYKCWRAMIDRCTNPKNQSWKDYGGRGITVCQEWQDDFESFRDWAYQKGYSDDLTIERKDVNDGYHPDNVTFIPLSEQAKNRRNSPQYRSPEAYEKYLAQIKNT